MILDMRTIIGVVLRPLLFSIYFLSGLMPRTARRCVFGSWSGRRYGDNSAALFEYVAQLENGDRQVIWISHNRAVIAELRNRGLAAHAAWSLRGIYACLTAGVFVFDGLTKDINHWLSRGARKVLLRHGVGIKKIERAIEHPGHRLYKLFHGTPLQRLFWSYLLPWHLVRPDLIIATSADHAAQGRLYYGVGEERLVVTGFPRNDRMLRGSPKNIDSRVQPLIERSHARGLPIFLYLPTFRDDDSRFEFPLAEMEAMAARLGIMLLVKLHFVDGLRNKDFAPAHDSNLCLLDAAIDANDLFSLADGLISDYSSVVFDFILTGKPVIFYVPDLDEYLSNSRSFYYGFDEVTPGPKPRTIDELEQSLVCAIDDGLSTWRPHYQSVLSRFHTHHDARSCERTWQAISDRFIPQSVDEMMGALREFTSE